MNAEDKTSAKSVVRRLARLPILDRVRIVKDLILRELGGIHSHVSAVHEATDSLVANDWRVLRAADAILSELSAVHALAEGLLENDSPLLQSTISLVEAVQEVRLEIDRQGQLLLSSIKQAQQEGQRQLEGLFAEGRRQLEGLFATVGRTEHESARLLEDGHLKLEAVIREQGALVSRALDEALKAALRQDPDMGGRVRVVPSDTLPTTAILLKDGASVDEPEVNLMAHLYSYLPSRIAVDIGANVGDVSNRLLEAGYEVYAFEPNSAVFPRLRDRLAHHTDFHCFPWALGPIDDTRHLYSASDLSGSNRYRDATLYSSLMRHSMPEDLVLSGSSLVSVRSLESLHASKHVPINAGLVKIDTEGFDLEVIRGMGPHRYPVVVAEYWDPAIPFGLSGAMNVLDDMVKEMKAKGYQWYIVFYRIWGKEGISFYCNHPRSVAHTYGNVFFFQEHRVFAEALRWCSAVLLPTYVGR